MNLSHSDFTLFFLEISLVLMVAYGVGVIVRLKFIDFDLIFFRRCMLGFALLNVALVLMAQNAGMSFLGGEYWYLEIIKFLAGYFGAWACLCGLEKRELKFWELFLPSFYFPNKKTDNKKLNRKEF